MVNLKTYRDGERMVLVIENCKGELEKKVESFISDLIGLNTSEQTNLVPVKVQEEPDPTPKITKWDREVSVKETSSPKKEALAEFVTALEFKEFLEKYQEDLKESINKLLSLTGYANINDLIAFGDEKTLQDAYQALREKLIAK